MGIKDKSTYIFWFGNGLSYVWWNRFSFFRHIKNFYLFGKWNGHDHWRAPISWNLLHSLQKKWGSVKWIKFALKNSVRKLELLYNK